MNVACPACSTVYRIDPARVPMGGVGTRCRECGTSFRVDRSRAPEPGAVVTGSLLDANAGAAAEPDAGAAAEAREPGVRKEPADTAPSAPSPSSPSPAGPAQPAAPAERTAPAFGPQEPQTRARRLARALVSDIKVYNPDKWEESRTQGTLRTEFREEIMKSWEEYVEQVGEDMAKKTPYFRDALNEILAGGERVF